MSEPGHHGGASSTSVAFFESASGVVINGGTFIAGNVAAGPHDVSYKHLKPLYKLVAQNAILNQGGRADQVRCYPGTREEVISKVVAWRDSGYILDTFIFWLSGPAGAGKSAIVQTVAERCIKEGIPMINFFFFRADGTRNHARSLVSTLLFQLLKIVPALKAHISAIVREDPVIFSASLANQFRTLISDPILHLKDALSARPILLLIDGLDECDSKTDQSTLLRILHDLVSFQGSPFIALVASRAESQIVMAFNSIQTFHGSIFLDDSYRPDNDIRLYVRSELAEVRNTHTLRQTLGPEWPPEDDINAIVSKSSGQFIYAATVVRFVSNPSKSPQASLQTVLGIRLAGKRTPFAEIDALYMHILSQVDDWDFVREVIFVNSGDNVLSRGTMLCLLGYTLADIESSLIDVAPIIRFDRYSSRFLHFYHASFNDFLRDRTRAGTFYMDLEIVSRQLLQNLITRFCTMTKFPSMDLTLLFATIIDLLANITTPTVELTLAFQQIAYAKGTGPANSYLVQKDNHQIDRIMGHIERINNGSDFNTCAAVIRSWVAWFKQFGIFRSELSKRNWVKPTSASNSVRAHSKPSISESKSRRICATAVSTATPDQRRPKPPATRTPPVDLPLARQKARHLSQSDPPSGTDTGHGTTAAQAPAPTGARSRSPTSDTVPTPLAALRPTPATRHTGRPRPVARSPLPTSTAVRKDTKAATRQPPAWKL